MASVQAEKKLLQRVVAIAALGPVFAGLDGALMGARMLGGSSLGVTAGASFGIDSQFRFLSGLLFAIGVGYLTTIPRIEQRRERFDLLTCLIFAGGLARLLGIEFIGLHSLFTLLLLVVELVVAPVLCIWQHRIANRFPETPGA